jgi:hypothetical protein
MKKDHLEILLEDIKGKFELVLEGHETLRKEIRDTREDLNEKIELNFSLIKVLNKKIDGVAADLTAHRADTERHGAYKVSENKK